MVLGELSDIEQNAVRYTAGSVIHKLKEIQKMKTKEGTECLAVLNNMGRKMQVDESQHADDQKHSSTKWMKLVNRGGLCFVQDVVYDLFIAIELH